MQNCLEKKKENVSLKCEVRRIIIILTDAGTMPAVVALWTVGDAVITQQPGPWCFTP